MSRREQAKRTVLFVGGPKHGTMELLTGYLAHTRREETPRGNGHGGEVAVEYLKRKAGLTIYGRYREIVCYAIPNAPPELLVQAIEMATRKDALDTAQGKPSLWTPGDN